ncbi:PTS glucose transporter subunit IIA [Gracilibacillus salitolerans]|uniref:PTS glucose transporter subunit IIA n=1 Tax=Gracilibacillus salitolerans TaxID=2663022 RepID=A0A5Q2TNW8_9BACI|nr:PTS glucose transporter subunit IIA [Gracilibacillus salitolerans]QGH35802.1 PTS glucose transporter subunit IIA [Gracilibacillus salitolerans]
MFKNLLKRSSSKLQIKAPITGEILPLEKVPDPVFSQKMMGEGIAIIPKEENIVAPVEGTIIQIAPSKHAIGLKAKDGMELLIHVGLETVSLKGEGFKVLVNEGDHVSVGDKLMVVDLDYIRNKVQHIITPVVITNSNQSSNQYYPTAETECQAGKTSILTVDQ